MSTIQKRGLKALTQPITKGWTVEILGREFERIAFMKYLTGTGGLEKNLKETSGIIYVLQWCFWRGRHQQTGHQGLGLQNQAALIVQGYQNKKYQELLKFK